MVFQSLDSIEILNFNERSTYLLTVKVTLSIRMPNYQHFLRYFDTHIYYDLIYVDTDFALGKVADFFF